MTVNRTEIAAGVRPFIPDRDAVLLQIADIGVAGEEPQQLVDDRLDMQLLGRDQREALAEVEAHLVAEHALGAGARAVALDDALVENVLQQVVILLHGVPAPATRYPCPTLTPCRQSLPQG